MIHSGLRRSIVCLVALGAGLPAAAAAGPAPEPFENLVMRPVPGYTMACQGAWEVGGIRRSSTWVVAVVPDGDGSRVRDLRKDADGRTAETIGYYGPTGVLLAPPEIRVDGVVQTDRNSALVARAALKYAEAGVGNGAPVSSGDTFVSSVTAEEAHASMTRFWSDIPKLEQWAEAGVVTGKITDPEFGDLVVVENAARTSVRLDGEAVVFSFRYSYYVAVASGLSVRDERRMRMVGPGVDIRGEGASTCRYATQPEAKRAPQAAAR